MKRSYAGIAIIILSATAVHAQHRVEVIPSLEIKDVNDDNLNVSATGPLRDRVRRVTPGLAFRFDSPRFSSRMSFGIDSEQYAEHSAYDDRFARERAGLAFQFQATRRLTFALDSSYLATNSLTELNTDTGLAAARIRGRRIGASPSAMFRISPRMTATASASSIVTTAANGFGMRLHEQSFALDRRMTSRDSLNVSYGHSDAVFNGISSERVRTDAVRLAWTREAGAHNRLMLHVGPRMTDGSYATDLAASLMHTGKASATGVSLSRSQTTVIGYAGFVQTDALQGTLAYEPAHNITLFAAPALLRSVRDQIHGLVYRFSGGARYSVTSFLQAELLYNRDIQNGGIDVMQPNAKLSHSTFSFGFTTRPNIRDAVRQ